MSALNTMAVMLFSLLVASAAAGADDFEVHYAQAQANARTKAGAAFDASLAATYEQLPGFIGKVTNCLRSHPGAHKVRGYFRFLTAKDYQVVLDPQDGFSSCLAPVLAGPSLPTPPSVPYLNPFSFEFTP